MHTTRLLTPRPLKSTALALSAVLLSALSLQATTTVVDWGGDYVTTNQNFQRTGNPIDYSDSAALNPVIGANYDGTSARFFGGGAATDGFLGTGYQQVRNNVAWAGAVDAITFRVSSGPSSTATEGAALFMWQKADFLGGMNTATVAMTSDSSLSVTFGMENITGSTSSARFVVQQGADLYISDTVSSLNTAGSTLTFNLDPSTSTWSSYSPGSTHASFAYAADTQTITLNDIRAVGVQFEMSQPNANSFAAIGVNDFTVTAIPEPGMAALLAAGMVGLVVGFRRRRKE